MTAPRVAGRWACFAAGWVSAGALERNRAPVALDVAVLVGALLVIAWITDWVERGAPDE